VLGWRSGEKAAEYAKEVKEVEVDDDQVKAEEARATSPFINAEGFTWMEVNEELNNIMEEYQKYMAGFNPSVSKDQKSVSGLNNCLDQLTKLKATNMKAADSHELVRCNEVMNLIDVGIMMVTAAFDERQFNSGVWFLGKKDGCETRFRTKPIFIKYPSEEDA